ncbi:MAG: stalled ribosome rescue protein Dom34 [Marinoscillum sp.]|jgi:stalled ribosome rescue protein Dom34
MNINNLGIWMDHSTANLIGSKGSQTSHTIASEFTHDKEVDALNKGENLMHNKRQQLHEAYYKEIAAEIVKYDHVLLFGPTNAKTELHNYLNKDLHFKDIKIDIKSADKMTDNEQNAFVKSHFDKL